MNLKTEQFPLKVALLAFLYLALNAITQGLVSQTADLDQAQQLLLSQELAWGYGRQPPVYTWIVNGVFRITGPEVWSLRLIKVVILFVLVVAILMVGKELGLTESQQGLSVLGLALIPQLVWEAQRDLTHSPLATMMGALTLWCVLRLRKRPDVQTYVLLGVLVAAGLLSKFNSAVFLLSVMVGALLTPDYRRLVLSPKLLISMTVALALLIKPVTWIASNLDEASASTEKLQTTTSFNSFSLIELALAILAFLLPLLIAFLLSWSKTKSPALQSDHPDRQLLNRIFLACLMILLIFFFATGAIQVKDRWLQPLLFFLPVLLVVIGIGRRRVFMGFGMVVIATVGLMLPGRTLLVQWNPDLLSRPNYPYQEIGFELARQVPNPDVVLYKGGLIGGNLRPVFPKAKFQRADSATELAKVMNEHHGKHILFVLDNPKLVPNFEPWREFNTAFPNQSFNLTQHGFKYLPDQLFSVYWIEIGRPR